MTLELSFSQEAISKWSIRESNSPYSDPKSISDAQSILERWKESAQAKANTPAKKANVTKLIDSIDIRTDVQERNREYIEEVTIEINDASTIEELNAVTIDDDFEPTTKSLVTRRKGIKNTTLIFRQQLAGESIEQLQARTRASLRVLGAREDEVILIKDQGIKPDTL